MLGRHLLQGETKSTKVTFYSQLTSIFIASRISKIQSVAWVSRSKEGFSSDEVGLFSGSPLVDNQSI